MERNTLIKLLSVCMLVVMANVVVMTGARAQPTPAVPGTASAPVFDPVVPPLPSPLELDQDIAVAVSATDTYWRTHWSEFFTGSYSPPLVLGGYDSLLGGGPSCGGPALPNNAFYCGGGGNDFLAWDVQLMVKGAVYGDSWVYAIIAHEWGHAVQARLAAPLKFQAAELQADCLAGAVLYGASRDGLLSFEAGDEAELATAMEVVADATPWTNEGDHGNADERIANFAYGRDNGVPGCLPVQSR